MIISIIFQRLQEVNTLLATCRQGSITFEQALLLSLFYKDFNETNQVVTLKPFESRYENAKEVSTGLWRESSAMSNRLDVLPLNSDEYKSLDSLCDTKKAEYDTAHTQTDRLYNEWQQERDRTFCVYCFKPMFLTVLVERLKGISESIISDIRRMKEETYE